MPVSYLRFRWISDDGKVLIAVRGVRTFAQGAATVLVAIYLDMQGVSLVQIGLFLTLGSIGGTISAILAGVFGDSFGRRRMLMILSALAVLTGIALASTTNFTILAIAAFLGSFGAFAGASGGIGAIEQAILPSTSSDRQRTDVFTIYGIVGAAAMSVGALAAGIPSLLQGLFNFSEGAAIRALFAGYAAFGVVNILLYTRLSPAIEVTAGNTTCPAWTNPFLLPSRARIFSLAGLFTVDSFGTGLIPQSLVSYWFFTRFDLQPEELGLLFFASGILTALSLWVAARLARIIGLLNTIVFTHIPSSVFVMAIPFVPDVWMAIVLWLLRAFFSQMDVPTGQSYTMAVVRPEERTTMASAEFVGRSSGIAAGPSVATALWSTASSSIPFIAGGAVKITYDLALWLFFRKVKPPEEMSPNV